MWRNSPNQWTVPPWHMVSRPSYVASTDCMLRSTLLSICFSHKSDNRTMAHCQWDVFSHAPMAAPYVTTLPVRWLPIDWRYVPLWKGLLNAWFFGTSKIHWFVTGFEFTISIAIILIPHVHAPVFYIVANPKLSCFPICSSHFSKLKALNFPHRFLEASQKDTSAPLK